MPSRIAEFLNGKKERGVEQGQRFHYASIETEILGRVLRRATGKSVTSLTEEWLWQPMGAQDRAHWIASTTDGAEATAGGFNASLRDYGRFGMLLANDGVRITEGVGLGTHPWRATGAGPTRRSPLPHGGRHSWFLPRWWLGTGPRLRLPRGLE
jgi:CubicO group peptidase (beta-lactamase class C family)